MSTTKNETILDKSNSNKSHHKRLSLGMPYKLAQNFFIPQQTDMLYTQRSTQCNSQLSAVTKQTSQQQTDRINKIPSLKLIRPITAIRQCSNDINSKQSQKQSYKILVKEKVKQACEYNQKGQFLKAFQEIDILQRQLLLSENIFKPYIIQYYRVFIVTCLYLTVQYKSYLPLKRAENYIDYFLKNLLKTDLNIDTRQAKFLHHNMLFFKKIKLMSIRLQINLDIIHNNYENQKISDFVKITQDLFSQMKDSKSFNNTEYTLIQTTTLIDISMLLLLQQANQNYNQIIQLLEKCANEINIFIWNISSEQQQLEGDMERLKLNYIYSLLLLGFVKEQQEAIEYQQYYQQCLKYSKIELQPNNSIKIFLDNIFHSQEQLSIKKKIQQDLNDTNLVNQSELTLIKSLFIKKIQYDLLGNQGEQLQLDDQILSQEQFENYFSQLPTQRYNKQQLFTLNRQNSQKAPIISVSRTSFKQFRCSSNPQFDQLELKQQESQQSCKGSKSPLSIHKRKTIRNIELVQPDQPGQVNEIRSNFAKILKINEEKKVLLDEKFFEEKEGNQNNINNEISKSVEKFFKQTIMNQLKLTSQSKKSDFDSNNKQIGIVIADQETSGKTFWKRFMVEQADFAKKIYLNENVEEFKQYFDTKLKCQQGNLDRKVLSTFEDFQALKYYLNKKKEKLRSENNKDDIQIRIQSYENTKQNEPISIVINQMRKNSSSTSPFDSFRDAIKQYKDKRKINIQDQSQKFLQNLKDYDAIGKIIQFNQDNEIFKEAFQQFLPDISDQEQIDFNAKQERLNVNSNNQSLKSSRASSKKESELNTRKFRQQVSSFNKQCIKEPVISKKVSPVDYWLHQQVYSDDNENENIQTQKQYYNGFVFEKQQEENIKRNQAYKDQIQIDIGIKRKKINEVQQNLLSKQGLLLSSEKTLQKQVQCKKPFTKMTQLAESIYGIGTLDY